MTLTEAGFSLTSESLGDEKTYLSEDTRQMLDTTEEHTSKRGTEHLPKGRKA